MSEPLIEFRSVVDRPSNCPRLAFAGDLCLPPGEGGARADSLGAVASRLGGVDLGVVNLEGPILDGAGDWREGVTVHLRNAPEALDAASACGFRVMNLANNHIMDFGAPGLRSTLAALDRAGLRPVGAGEDRARACAPLHLDVRGKRVGLLAYTTDVTSVRSVLASESAAGCASMRYTEAVLEQVRSLRRDVDLVVVLLHWGQEYYRYPAPEQVQLARGLVDAGAGLVIGHHPHVLQGVEFHRRGVIAYSLGNFFFPRVRSDSGRRMWEKRMTRDFLVLVADFKDDLAPDVSFLAGRKVADSVLAPFTAKEARLFARRFARLCEPLRRPDYPTWYTSYAARRKRALEREALAEVFLKVLHTPVGELVRTVRVEDFRRTFRRFTNPRKHARSP